MRYDSKQSLSQDKLCRRGGHEQKIPNRGGERGEQYLGDSVHQYTLRYTQKNTRTVAAGLLLWPNWKTVLSAKPQECHKIRIEIPSIYRKIWLFLRVQPWCSRCNLKICFDVSSGPISASTVEERWQNEKSQWQSGFQLFCWAPDHLRGML